MRRSIDEVKTELQKRSAEFEKRRRARVKSLAIGAGAALVLMLAAVPVISGVLSAKNGSPMPMTAAYSGGNNSAALPTTDGAAQNGMAQSGTDNFKPPRVEDGATTDGMPASSEPTALPGAPSNSGSNSGGTDGAPSYDPDGIVEWYDFSFENEGYFMVKRGEIIPEKASLTVVNSTGKHSCEIEDENDIALLTAALYGLLDNVAVRESEEPIGSTEYNLDLIKDECRIWVSCCDDGSLFIGSGLYTADEESLNRFNSIVYVMFEKHAPLL